VELDAPARRILLLGASGFVGGGLWTALSARHEVVGTCSSRDVDGLLRLDLRDAAALAELVRRDFDLVIHCAGLVDLVAAETAPELARRLNVESVRTVRDALRDSPTTVVLISTDNVFAGTAEAYTELDEPGPVNAYGRSKLAAEQVLAEDPRHLVVRIPMIFGRSPWRDAFLRRFADPRTPAQTDLWCAPVYLPSLGPALERLWDRTGVVHYGGADVVTRFELMSAARRVLDLPTEVVPMRNDEASGGPRRPTRLVLRSVRHDLLGPGLDAALADLAAATRAGR
jgi:dTDP-4-dehydrorhamnose reductase